MRVFKLTERDLSPACREIRIEGDLDLAVSARLRQAIERAPQRELRLDLAQCDFMDTTGVALIVETRRRLGDADRTLSLHSPSGQVERVLTATGVG